jgi:hypothetical protein
VAGFRASGHRHRGIEMHRPLGSRLSAVLFAMTLLGVGIVGTSSSSATSGLTWSETASPTAEFIPPVSSTDPGLNEAGNNLNDVSCTSRKFCVAVGVVGESAPTLAEEWDGHRWFVSPRSAVAGMSALNGVSCASEHFCVAVGNTASGSGTQSIVETFNGIGWIYTLLAPIGVSSALSDVSCSSATECVAVGFTTDGTRQATLIESWNGATWSRVASPNSGSGDNEFAGVSCASRRFCVAVGAAATSTGVQPLIEKWNGSAWTVAAGAGIGTGTFGQVAGVSCTDSSFCMAAGSVDSAPFVETWHGNAWHLAAVPAPRTGFSERFAGVSCTGEHRCVAPLDESGPTPGSAGGFVQEWNGSTWAAGGGASGTSGQLAGVSCASKSFCFAVGGSHYFPHGSVALLGT